MTEPITFDKIANTPTKQQKSALPSLLACICFFVLGLFLARAFMFLHNNLIQQHYSLLEGSLKSDLIRLLGYLEIYRLSFLLCIAFGVSAFIGQPRWMRWVCIPLILFSLFMCFIII